MSTLKAIFRIQKKGTKEDNYNFYTISKSNFSIQLLKNNNLQKNIINSSNKISKDKTKKYLLDRSPLAFRHLNPCIFFINLSEHYSAIGKDQYGKDQYIYQKKFEEIQRKKKYCELTSFIQQQSILNKKTYSFLKNKKEHEKIYGLMYQIMNQCKFRIGSQNHSYASSLKKQTFGIRTIQKKHVSFSNQSVKISFPGKKGVLNVCSIQNPKLIKDLKDLSNKKKKDESIFTEKNKKNPISYEQWRDFLKQNNVSESKMIRTYYANYLFLKQWIEQIKKNQSFDKKILKENIEKIANELHHTPSILKKSYLSKELYLFSQSKEIGKNWLKKQLDKNKNIENIMVSFFKPYCSWI